MDGGERRRRKGPEGLCSAIFLSYRIIPHPVHWGEIINLHRWATAFPVVAAATQAHLAPLLGCSTSSPCVIMFCSRPYDTDAVTTQGSAECARCSLSAALLSFYTAMHIHTAASSQSPYWVTSLEWLADKCFAHRERLAFSVQTLQSCLRSHFSDVHGRQVQN